MANRRSSNRKPNRPPKWRLHADENIKKQTVDALRRANFDVVWVKDDKQLLKHKDDKAQLQRAREQGRYFVTNDTGFWDDSAYPLKDSPGTIILTAKDVKMEPWIVRLLRKSLVDFNLAPEPLTLDGMKVKLSDQGIDVKGVDHDTQKKVTEHFDWRELY